MDGAGARIQGAGSADSGEPARDRRMTAQAHPSRPFGLPSATALVVANMIGAGVFTTSGFSLADLGSRRLVLVAWVLGGAIAYAGAVSYGLLSSRIQESGGEYVFLSRTFHPAIGFVAGWVSLLAGFTGAIAFAASAFEAYALPAAVRPGWAPEGGLAMVAIALLAALHGLTERAGLRLQNAIVLAKLLALVAFVAYAVARLGGEGWVGLSVEVPERPFSPYAFAGSLVWISLSYSGFNAAAYVLGEVRDAALTGPRAMLYGTLVTTALYVAINGIFLYAPRPEELVGRGDVAVVAAESLGGGPLVAMTRGVIALALLTSVSSMIIAGPRVYDRMARDGVFPAWLAVRRGGAGVAPVASIAFQALLACVVVAIATLEELLSYLGFTLSLCAAATVMCLFVSRPHGGPRPAPGALVAPAFYLVCTVGLAALAAIERPWQLVAALLTVFSGLALYALSRSKRSAPPSP